MIEEDYPEMTGLITPAKPDGFKTESPIRAFTTFDVSGTWAIGKGFRPSLGHLHTYLDGMQNKEGWQLIQILDGSTLNPTMIFQRIMSFTAGKTLGEPYVPKGHVDVFRKYKTKTHGGLVTNSNGVPVSDEELVDVFRKYKTKTHGGLVTNSNGVPVSDEELVHWKNIDWAEYDFYKIAGKDFLKAEKVKDWAQYWETASVASVRRLLLLIKTETTPDTQVKVDNDVTLSDGGTLSHADDPVNPKHYAGRDCADIGERLSANGYQILKYCWRLRKKDDPCVELGKALWYLDSEMEFMKSTTFSRINPIVVGIAARMFFEQRIADQSAFTQHIARLLWAGYNQEELQTIRTRIENERFEYECGRGLAI